MDLAVAKKGILYLNPRFFLDDFQKEISLLGEFQGVLSNSQRKQALQQSWDRFNEWF